MTPGRTPVLAGIGVATQREEDPARAMDPLGLMMQAVRAAAADSSIALLPRIGRILVPKGRWSYTDPARAIAHAIGAPRAVTVLATVGVLQQSLIADACGAIAGGEAEAALVVGADAGFRILRARITGHELPKSDPEEGRAPPDVLLAPKEELFHAAEIHAGVRMPAVLYAILESAFRARRGTGVDAQRDHVAALYSRFSQIAADNPAAWTRRPLDAPAIRDPSERNPMQAFPYTKLLCSSWNVDQGSALLFCSQALADEAGLRPERLVHPWASTESNHMVPVCARAELHACPGARIAGRAALDPFGLDTADIDLLELYSCFPIAVQAYAAELGIDPARDLTVTGGMSFAGGPFNNYVLQATARMASLLREAPRDRARTGLVSSVSGILTKQGFGLWSTEPPPRGFHQADVSDAVARASPEREVVVNHAGDACIAGFAVVHDPSRAPCATVVADLADGRRTVALCDDPSLVARMAQEEFCGVPVAVQEGKVVGLR